MPAEAALVNSRPGVVYSHMAINSGSPSHIGAAASPTNLAARDPHPDWWRHAVLYQVYVRSFCDSNGDGLGDLSGVRLSLDYLTDLGVDGIWLNPHYRSPQHDHGYDISDHCAVEPTYGTLADFEELVGEAHRIGLRALVDLVPNHCSVEHPHFREALARGRDSEWRELFIFRDGAGEQGELPPNNWRSLFGGPAWHRVTETDGRPGQWYLHLYAPEQPDWNWRNPKVREYFEHVLRYWLALGVDGFRIDAAAGLYKDEALRDTSDPSSDEFTGEPNNRHAWGQPELHLLYKRWRDICEEAAAADGRERVLVGEIGGFVAEERLRSFLRPGELHQAFLFALLDAPWDPKAFRRIIERELDQSDNSAGRVAWVLGNHDRVRMTTRYDTAPHEPGESDGTIGAARARAAALLLLALPGPVYLYQGDELGLPEVTSLPEELITDPIFRNSGGQRRGRDGCRVPLPWHGAMPPFGFSQHQSQVTTWLPQPDWFAGLTVERQRESSASTWHLYRSALALRRNLVPLKDGELGWLSSHGQVLAFTRGKDFTCAVNFGSEPAEAPSVATPLLSSTPLIDAVLPPNTAAWWV